MGVIVKWKKRNRPLIFQRDEKDDKPLRIKEFQDITFAKM